ncbi:alanine racemase [Macrococcus armenti]|uniref:Alanine racemase n=1 Tax=Macrococcus armenti TaxID=2875764 RepID=A0ABY3ZRT2_9STAP|nr:alanine racemase [Macrococcus armenti]UOB19596.1 alanine racemase [Macrococcus armenti]
MTAKWTVNQRVFQNNVTSVINNTPVIAVVKNNAYHFGLQFAIKSFQRSGITAFSTTKLEEAVEIRALAPDAMIFLMNPVTEFDVLRANNIHMTLPSLSFYKQYKDDLYDVHLHLEFENLLHRSGFKTFEEIKIVIDENNSRSMLKQARIVGLWTHFGYADEFDIEEYEIEKEQWLKGLGWLRQYYNFKYIHSQNSASYMRDGLLENHTHARIGIALYGCRPYASLDENVTTQSLKVSANVIQIRDINQGESIGYSFAYTAKDNIRIAVVDIGYGDGILRTRSKYDCLINGKRYQILAIMMSHMFVEVDSSINPQDEVILYSNDIRIDTFTFKGVGANSEQLSALNHQSLKKEYEYDTKIY